MAAVAHGGDAGGDPPPPNWVPERDHVARKRVRGRNTNLNLREKFVNNGSRPLPIQFDEHATKTWSPLGDNGQMFVSLLGSIVHEDNFPRHYASWKDVPEGEKTNIWPQIQIYFDLRPYLGGHREQRVRAAVEALCAHSYRDAKWDWKKKYFIARGGFEHPDHLRNDPPPGIPTVNWERYTMHVTDPKVIARSVKNTANRSQLPFTSKHGSRSYANWRARRQADDPSHPVGLIDNWRHMHYDQNTGYWNSPMAQNLYEQMVNLSTQSPSTSEEDVMDTVLGTRRGHKKGRGRQLPLSVMNAIPTSSASSSGGTTSRPPPEEGRFVRVEEMMSWMQQIQAANPNFVLPPLQPLQPLQPSTPDDNDEEDDD